MNTIIYLFPDEETARRYAEQLLAQGAQEAEVTVFPSNDGRWGVRIG